MNKFDNIRHENFYITNKKLSSDVKYQIRNGIVIIDIKELVDSIMDEEGIGKYKTEKMTLNIPFDMNKQVTGNSINLIIDKKRFLIRLEAMEILPSKQQKIDYDNTHAHRWTIPQWVKLIEDLYYQAYGVRAMELDLRGNSGNIKRGRVFGQVNKIKNKILGIKDFNFVDNDVVEYLRWAFTFKSKKVVLCLGLLNADTMVQEWLVFKKKQLSAISDTKERKWNRL